MTDILKRGHKSKFILTWCSTRAPHSNICDNNTCIELELEHKNCKVVIKPTWVQTFQISTAMSLRFPRQGGRNG
jgi:hypothetical protein